MCSILTAIASNDEKTILGFIWLLIRQFQLKSSTDSVAAGRLSSARMTPPLYPPPKARWLGWLLTNRLRAYTLLRTKPIGDEDLDVLERELRRAMEATMQQQQQQQQKPVEPKAPVVAVVESEKKVQRERTKEKPAIKGTPSSLHPLGCACSPAPVWHLAYAGLSNAAASLSDGTHSTVVSETLKGSKFRVKAAQLEDMCSKCAQPITDATLIQVDSGAKYDSPAGTPAPPGTTHARD
jgi:hypothetical protein